MGVKERRERQKEMLRQDILDAARELFVKEGYDNVSMRKIAEKIEYSPTTIYLYFQDKSELLFHLCEETFAKLLAELQVMDKRYKDPFTRLRAGLRAYVEFGLNHPNHYRVAFLTPPESHEHPEKFQDPESMGQRAYFALRADVEKCIKAHNLQLHVDTMAQSLWASVHGLTSLLILKCRFKWVDREELIENHINTITLCLAPPQDKKIN